MVYGYNTKSYLRSTEHRESKRQQKIATEQYLAAPRVEVIVGPICTCRSFRYPHELSVHRKLKGDWDWRTWQEREAGPEWWEEPVR